MCAAALAREAALWAKPNMASWCAHWKNAPDGFVLSGPMGPMAGSLTSSFGVGDTRYYMHRSEATASDRAAHWAGLTQRLHMRPAHRPMSSR